MENKKEKKRFSNFELLRIICMILIIAHHYSRHGSFSYSSIFSFNSILSLILSLGGKIGVNVFVLITGYFLAFKEGIRWKRIAKLAIQLSFFSLFINAGFCIVDGYKFGALDVINSIIGPIPGNFWWFATTYFVLNLFTPYLNCMLNNISRKKLFVCIITMFLIWSVLPTIIGKTFEYNNLIWFVFLYLIAAYIKKYQDNFFCSQKVQICIFIVTTLIVLALVVFFDYLCVTQDVKYYVKIKRMADMNNVLILIQSISLFCIFKNLKMGQVNFINTIASAMFGVYLLHDHTSMRKILWKEIFNNAAYQNSNLFFVHAFISIAIVFIVGTIVSLLYNWIIDKNLDKLLNKIKFKNNYKGKFGQKISKFKNKINDYLES